MARENTISVSGASQGDLDGVDIDIPLNKMVCFSGRPGSGSRTMAIDVLYAESRRRYMLALAPWEREYLGGMGSVDVENITGLPPVIYIRRQAIPRGETISSYLQLDDLLGQLFLQFGQVHCLKCGSKCAGYKPDEAVEVAIERFAGERILILAPLDVTEAMGFNAIAKELKRAGFTRVRVRGEVEQIDKIEENISGRLEIVIDRVVTEPKAKTRMVEAVRTARSIAGGESIFIGVESGCAEYLNSQLTCAECGTKYEDLCSDDLTNAENCDLADGVTLVGKRISELTSMPLVSFMGFIEGLDIAADLCESILEKMAEIRCLGLGYLELHRQLSAVSSGELQRVKLAHCLANGLVGILYIFDAPLADMGFSERQLYLEGLKRLVGKENTVLILDHHKMLGNFAESLCNFTDEHIQRVDELKTRTNVQPSELKDSGGTLRVEIGADVFFTAAEFEFPLRQIISIKGPSGAGKSRLLDGLAGALNKSTKYGALNIKAKVRGGREISRVIVGDVVVKGKALIDELGITRHMAQIYAETPAAQKRGYNTDIFSLDKPGGRCPTCEGRGFLQYDMQFLEDISVNCPSCEGRRFRSEILEITLRGMNIDDVLDMTCVNARYFFSRDEGVVKRLDAALLCGLGRHCLGEDCRALEPIERLYLQLAKEITMVRNRDILLLDHPTAGAHPDEIDRLIGILRELVGKGASVLVADHHEQMLKAADWVVELGPGAGPEGGQIISSKKQDGERNSGRGKSA